MDSPHSKVAYETYGEFSGDNAVLVCHALTGSAHVAGSRRREDTAGQAHAWWDDIVGPGKAIDTTEYYVVCANVPGSCYGSSGPASTNPETGEPWRFGTPSSSSSRRWARVQSPTVTAGNSVPHGSPVSGFVDAGPEEP